MCFPGENLDLWSDDDGAWRRFLAGGIVSEALPVAVVVVVYLPSLISSTLSGLQRSSSGGYFVAFGSLVDTLSSFCRGGCFAASVGRVDALPPFVTLSTFAPYMACSIFSQVRWWSYLGLWVACVLPVFLVVLTCVRVEL